MNGPRLESVDERDSSWEDNNPHFRVYLHGSGENVTHGATATYDIRGADLLQVIDWSQRQAGSHLTFAIALVRDDPDRPTGDRRGLVWLVGMDGNDVAHSAQESSVQERMLIRRTHPVGIARNDRMPGEVGDIPGAPLIFSRDCDA
ncbi:hypothetical protein BH09ACT12_BH09ACT12_27930 [soil metagenome]